MFRHLFNPLKSIDHKEVIMKLAYSPINEILDQIVNITVTKLSLHGYKAFDNYDDLMSFLAENNYFSGVVFDERFKNITDYPKLFNFSLVFPAELRAYRKKKTYKNWKFNRHYPGLPRPGPRNIKDADGGSPVGYYREGFLQLQHALSITFIELVKNKYSPNEDTNGTIPKIYLQRMPHPRFLLDKVVQQMAFIYPIVAVVSIILPIMQMVMVNDCCHSLL